jgi:cysteinyl-tRNA synthetase
MLVLNSHYRSPLDFSDAALTAAQSGLDRIIEAVKKVRKALATAPASKADLNVTSQIEDLKSRFGKAMDDDINTSIAMSVIYEIVKLANTATAAASTSKQTLEQIDAIFRSLGGDVLGIVLSEYPETASAADDELLDYLMRGIIEQRAKARADKDWAKADEIRNTMAKFNITFKDTPEGTVWLRG